MNKKWEDIKIGDRIKCINQTHGMFEDTGIITAKDGDIDKQTIYVKWDNSLAKNCCYFESFEVLGEVCNLLEGGEVI